MDDQKLAIVLLSAVVIVAGCTNGDDDGIEGEGLEITSFEAFPADPFTGENVNLEMEVLNNGDEDAEIQVARIYGHQVVQDEPRAWSMQGGENQNKDSADLTSSTVEGGSDDFEPLPQEITWRMESPEELARESERFTWNTEVYYDYETTATTSVDLIDSREERGDAGLPSTTNTRAPVRMDVDTRSPIMVDEDQDEAQVRVEVSNTGLGDIYHPDTNFEVDPFEIVDGAGERDERELRNSLEVTLEDPPGEPTIEGENTVDIDTRGTGVHTYTLNLPETFNSPLTVNLEFNADYLYETETATGVTVSER